MHVENADRNEINRILSAALDDPATLSEGDVELALASLESDAKRVRVGAAWLFGLLAADSSDRALSHLPALAARIDGADRDSEAARALGYIVATADPAAIERALRALDDPTAKQCRTALWGQFSERRIIETRSTDAEADGTAMGWAGTDKWGWVGADGTATAYDGESDSDRRRPPTDRPADPPAVDYDADRYTPIELLHRDDAAACYKVIYRGPNGGVTPGIHKRFDPPRAGFERVFDRRLRMWQSIDGHDGVLPVVDWGTDPSPWLVTAYEDVGGLADLGRNGRFGAAVWVLRTVVETLRLAHADGVIHGALTPGSVVRSSILTEPDAWRFPRVTDWGYVGPIREAFAPDSVPDRYLAPEHAAGSVGTIDGATDVYGFGVIAHEALAGRPPSAPGEDADQRIALPTAVDGRFPELGGFLRRCLAERKTERFETVGSMADAFRTAVGDEDG